MSASASSPAAEEKQEAAPVTHCKGVNDLDKVVLREVRGSSVEVAVFTDISLDKAFQFDDYCRSHQPPISFIKTEVCGLFGSVFCDFGPEFTVHDLDGEDPHTGIIAFISNDNPATVYCIDGERLDFQEGDLVVFSEVQGMNELNDGKPRKIIRSRPYSFCIEEDTSNFGIYT